MHELATINGTHYARYNEPYINIHSPFTNIYSREIIIEAAKLSKELDLELTTLSTILSVSEDLLNRFIEGSSLPSFTGKTLHLASLFIRVHENLMSLAGGDRYFVKQWLKRENDFFESSPLMILQDPRGFNRVLDYLESRRYSPGPF